MSVKLIKRAVNFESPKVIEKIATLKEHLGVAYAIKFTDDYKYALTCGPREQFMVFKTETVNKSPRLARLASCLPATDDENLRITAFDFEYIRSEQAFACFLTYSNSSIRVSNYCLVLQP